MADAPARRGSAQGDAGYTDLLGKRRVPKHHPTLEALGELDTATSALGVAKRAARQSRTRRLLHQMQADLYDVMSELAFPPEHTTAPRITDAHLAWLDRTLATVQAPFAQLRSFVLPGASDGSAPLDLARAHVRTAERRLTRVHLDGDLKIAATLTYVNRLSLVLYYLARAEDAAAGVDLDLAGAPRERPEA
jgi:cob(I)alamin adenosyltransferase